MSQSPSAVSSVKFAENASSDVTTVEGAEEIQHVLDALDDADCREILEATSEDARSANEVSDACDLPLSTTYRKLELLTDAGLLEERTRLSTTGKHSSEYVRTVEDVVVSLGTGGEMGLEVTQRARPARDR
ncbi:winged helix-turn-helix domain-containing protein [Halorientalis pallida]|uniref:ArsR family transcriptional regulator n=1 Tax=Halorientalis pallida TaxID=2479928 RepID=A0A498KS46_9EURY|nr:helix-turn-helix domain-containing protein [Halorientalis pallida]RXK46616.1 ArsR family transcriptional regulator [Halorientalis pallida]